MSTNWTTDNIPDLTGKIIIVTGANSGLGYETTKALAAKSGKVIMGCRSRGKAETAFNQIKAEQPNADLEIIDLDLASLASIRAFVDQFKAKYSQLDLLINNAGIMMVPYGLTEDGFERQLGTNHLGHFALTGLLFDLLNSTPDARVVNVSSTGHRMGSMDFDNLLYEGGEGYSPTRAYGRSKLANLLFTKELQNQFNAVDSSAIAVSAHPGGSDTNLGNHLESNLLFRIVGAVMGGMMQGADMGALPQIRAAVDPKVKGGEYYGPKGFMEISGYPVQVKSNAAANSDADAKQLWKMSEDLTGIKY
ncbi:MAG: oxidoreductase [Chloroflexota bacterium]